MCGIVGAISSKNVVPILIEGLKKLEYRGYDSAGLAVSVSSQLHIERSIDRVQHLEDQTNGKLKASIGIAHTRWATHGVPSVRNAHPHHSGSLAVVHNGIIENYEQFRTELQAKGYVFHSDPAW